MVYNKYGEGFNKWHLRMGVTPQCNFRCVYCLPMGVANSSLKNAMTPELIQKIILASSRVGITRLHWTGGEPTTNQELADHIQYAYNCGFDRQIITTNGKLFHERAESYKKAGLSRVIVSLDTLNKNRFKQLVGVDCLEDVLKSIEKSVQLFDSTTKLSVVTMKTTMGEIDQLVDYVDGLNSKGYQGKVAIKLNQFFPCNPMQLDDKGIDLWKDEFISYNDIMEKLNKSYSLDKLELINIDGDNPSYEYYQIKGTTVIIAILALYSWSYPCGGCFKLRVSPHGFLSSCITQKILTPIYGDDNIDVIVEKITQLISYHESDEFKNDFVNRSHYRDQLGELRFGVLGEAKEKEYFLKAFEKIINN